MVNSNNSNKKSLRLPKPAFVLEILLWLEFICSIFIKCFYFQFTTRLNIKPYFNSFNTNMLLSVLTSILFIIALALIIFNKKRLLALLFINILLSLLLFADTVYFRYYYCALSVPVLYQLGLVGSLADSIKSLLRIKDVIFVIDIPLIIIFLLLFRYAFKLKVEKIRIFKRLISAVIVFAIGFGLFQLAYSKASPGSFPYDNNYVANNLGVLYLHYYDVKNFMKENILVDKRLTAEEKKQIEDYYNNRKSGGDKYKGIVKGKNLIVIQMEAGQQFMINNKVNGKEVTPNLNRFMNDSAYFENFYYQIGGGNTADAEFLINTSLYPMQEGAVYFRFPTNTFDSTAKILKKQGYSTYVAHANNPSFWNRAEMYKTLGFDKFFNSKSYKNDELIGWGLMDKSFFRQTLDKLDTSKPFYSFFITLSSHHPFNFFANYGDFDVGKYDKTFLGNYIKAYHYLDESIGTLFDELKRRGLYDNSVIVIYGDHSAIPQDQAYSLNDFINYSDNPFNWQKLQRTACFIRFPGMENKGVQKITVGEIDILPTIANLLGIETPYAMGKDMFNTEKGYAVLRNASVVTDDFVYVNSANKVYDNSGKELNLKDYEGIIKQYQNQLLISDTIIKKNALSTGKLR